MPKRLERELNSIDSRSLYKSKRKMSSEPVLLGAIKTTELIDPPMIPLKIQNEQQQQQQEITGRVEQVMDGNDGIKQEVKEPPPPPTTTTTQGPEPFVPVPPSLLSNQSQPQQKTSTKINLEKGQSVLLNLTPGNDDENDGNDGNKKKRLSKIIAEVERMRQRRSRHNSFGSSENDDRMERTKENILRRLDKMKRSKQLLFKYKVYEFLKRPQTFWSTIYHVTAFVLVFTCLIVSIFPQMDPVLDEWGGKYFILDILEKIVVLWFTIEYLLRLWSCNCRSKYQGYQGKWNFIKAPGHLTDLFVVILSTLVMIWPHEGHEVFAFRAFRGFHRFFQVVQIIITERQLRPWRLFLSVLYDQREQLMIIFYLEIILFSLLAYLGFLVEHQSNDMLDTMAESVWWSIVTLTTVGYGDKVPISWRGKLISALFILFGFCVFALPAGIIGAGLALKLEQVEQSRQRRYKADSAARVIQTAWQCHHDFQSYEQLSSFFLTKSINNELYKSRILENLSHAFISLCRFHLAKAKFKQLTRSVDLRNIIESYKYGQMDIFSKLHKINQTMDQIMVRMIHAEHERIEALKQLTTHLSSSDAKHVGDDGKTSLIRTPDGTYMINTVSACYSDSIGHVPPDDKEQTDSLDLMYIPINKKQNDDGMGGDGGSGGLERTDSMRVRRSIGSSQTDQEPIPYMDKEEEEGEDNNANNADDAESELRQRKQRRNSK